MVASNQGSKVQKIGVFLLIEGPFFQALEYYKGLKKVIQLVRIKSSSYWGECLRIGLWMYHIGKKMYYIKYTIQFEQSL